MKLIKNNKGQSTIEFILTFTSASGFIFLFYKMADNYANGYMVHHATYMASRTFLVADTETQQTVEGRDTNALDQAKLVFAKYMPEALLKINGELKANNPSSDLLTPFIGVYIQFEQLFSISFIGGKDPVVFRSESFLGREPTRAESLAQVCEAIKLVDKGKLNACDQQATLDDNGG